MKADGVLPDDPLLHVCVLTYASDMTLLDSVAGWAQLSGVLGKGSLWWIELAIAPALYAKEKRFVVPFVALSSIGSQNVSTR